jgi:hypothetical protein
LAHAQKVWFITGSSKGFGRTWAEAALARGDNVVATARNPEALAAVEVAGATTQYGPEAARRTVLFGMLFGSPRVATADVGGGIETRFIHGILPTAPRVELVAHRGAWVFVHWYAHNDGEAVRAITRVELDGDRVAHLRNYFFNPDFIAEVCGELGLPWHSNGYRWSASACPGAPTATDGVADLATSAAR